MSHGTVTLPSRSYPALRGQRTPGFPAQLPGGVGGPAPIPSRATTHVAPPAPGGMVPGGNHGTVTLFTPSIDKTAPYFLGANEGFSIRTVDGSPIEWIRRFFDNVAGINQFRPALSATPDWTSNQARSGAATPASSIPMNRKRFAPGGLRRAAYQDEQLFTQLTDRRHPWPIQKPIPMMLRAQLSGQGRSQNPYWARLTRYTPAASYSQTTQTLVSGALNNVLPQRQPAAANPSPGASIYGTY